MKKDSFLTVPSIQWLLADKGHPELLLVPVAKSKDSLKLLVDSKTVQESLSSLLASKDFKGNEGEITFIYPAGKWKRVAVVGVGDLEKISVEKLRRSYAAAARACHAKKIKEVALFLPEIKKDAIRGVVEGLSLANYYFGRYKQEKAKKEPVQLIEKVYLQNGSQADVNAAKKLQLVSQGVHLARNLVNANAQELSSKVLGEVAQEIAKKCPHTTATVFDKKRIEKEGMGLLLAVNQGSKLDPAFIILSYKGAPKDKEHTVLIGKGITYDTGGLNLKPTGSMETMKSDMSGAAAVLSAVYVAATLGLKINVTAVVPSTDNAIGSNSFRPGDVYPSHYGKTVEIGNTDAEGRLVLADALSYVEKHLKPTRMVDLATLTGAIVVALGPEHAGLMSPDDQLAAALAKAGETTYERVWRLPLTEEYKDHLKSEVADLCNIGSGRVAGSIIGGLFLQEFVEKTPWAHLDIASTAFSNESRRYHGKHASGFGVRLLVEFLEGLK